MSKKIFITTPIYYSTDVPHLGTSYTTIAADVYTRYLQSQDNKVFFITGLDEHGAKVEEAAKAEGKSPIELADERVKQYRYVWEELKIKYSKFVRTSDPAHEKKVQDFLQDLYGKELIYKGEYKGLYCVGCEEYKFEKELVDGKCPLHNSIPEQISEPAYFFKLSQYSDQLLDKIDKGEFIIEPNERKNEVISFIKNGLEDIAISREKVDWGIKVPWDNSQTIYVWIDALLNYWTFAEDNWPADIHFIGKDILRFHAIIWPAMLLAKGEKLPKKVFAHGFFTQNGQKMSKTLGNKIDPLEVVQKYGVDALRYYLLAEIPFGQDGDVSWEGIERRYTADLANTLGNLVQRTLTMADKYGYALTPTITSGGEAIKKQIDSHYRNLEFYEGLEKIILFAREQNILIDQNKPWEIARAEPEKVKKLLGQVLANLEIIGKLLTPVIPDSAQKIIDQVTFKSLKDPIFPKLIKEKND